MVCKGKTLTNPFKIDDLGYNIAMKKGKFPVNCFNSCYNGVVYGGFQSHRGTPKSSNHPFLDEMSN